MQPSHKQPPRLLVGAPLLALHLCDLFWTSLRLYGICCGDHEEKEWAHRRVDGVPFACPTWAASASGEPPRLLCLNQAAAAMRVLEVGVMLLWSARLLRRCLSYVINLITAFFAAARAARPVALTCAAREECLELANDASKARTDRKELACTDTSRSPKKQRGQA